MPKDPDGAIKLQSPLYCAAWVEQYCFVAGGGGKKSSGIPNKLSCLEHSGSRLGQVVAELDFGEDAPLRMAVSPDHSNILVAVGSGGIRCVSCKLAAKTPTVTLKLQHGIPETLLSVGHAKCICFSQNGRLIAVGSDDGTLTVLDWPSGGIRKHLRSTILRDLDFSRAHGNKVLGAIYEDGSCILWEWESEVQLLALQLPADLQRGSFNRIRFARNGSASFFTVVNAAGQGHVLLWRQDSHGEVLLQQQCRCHSNVITAFDLSPSGQYFGTGTSEGEVAIFATKAMAPVTRVARAHMVFSTAVAFSSNGSSMLSVSADASARTTSVGPSSSAISRVYTLSFLILAVAVLLSLVVRTYMKQLPSM